MCMWPMSLDELKVSHILTPQFLSHKDEIDEIQYVAVKESDIELKFMNVQNAWMEEVFQFTAFHGRLDTLTTDRALL